MGVVGVVFAALAFAYPGTHEVPRLGVVAGVAAGKPVAVYCGDNNAAWAALVASLGGPPTADGFSDAVGGTTAYLSPGVCAELLNPSSPEALGVAILTLDHEATHLSGVTDEGVTDCTALGKVKLTAFFSFHMHRRTLARVYAAAVAAHRRKPAPYQGSC